MCNRSVYIGEKTSVVVAVHGVTWVQFSGGILFLGGMSTFCILQPQMGTYFFQHSEWGAPSGAQTSAGGTCPPYIRHCVDDRALWRQLSVARTV